MLNLFAVMGGGALGALLRHLLSTSLKSTPQLFFSPGIWLANVLGCFIFGISHQYLSNHPCSTLNAFLLAGFAGALTTFSTLCFEIFDSSTRLSLGHGAIILVAHLFLGLLFLFIGMHAGKCLF